MATVPDPCAALCVCGIRGCEMAEMHANGFLVSLPRFGPRRKARPSKRRR